MQLEVFPDLFYIITYGLDVLVLSLVAYRKNRNPLAWGFIGGLFGPCSLIYLAFLPRICLKCKNECKGRICPNCDSGLEEVLRNPATAPLLNTT